MTRPTPPVPPATPRRPRIDYNQLSGPPPAPPVALAPAMPRPPALPVDLPAGPAAPQAQPAQTVGAAVLTAPALITHQPPPPAREEQDEPTEEQRWWGIAPDAGDQDANASTDQPAVSTAPASPKARRKPAASAAARAGGVFTRGSAGMKLLGRITGLDRMDTTPTGKPTGRGKKKSVDEQQDWLTTVTGTAAAGEQPAPTEPAPSKATGPARPAPGDVQLSKAPRELGPTVWKIVSRTVLALFLIAGVKQVLWNPFFGTTKATTDQATAAVTLDPAAAAQGATRYATDYFTYTPTAEGATPGPGVTADVTADSNASSQRWTGTGMVQAGAALAGIVHPVDATHAVVAVTVRVHLSMPPTPVKATAATAKPGAPGKAAPSATAAAAPWRDLGDRWLQLSVPVQVDSGGVVKVGGGGAVFTGEAPTMLTSDPSWQSDSATAQTTQGVASTFFTAYGASDNLTYLTSAGTTLTGLSGATTLVSLTNWTVSTPAASGTATATGPTAAAGAGTVTWQLTGTDLQIQQPYDISLTKSENRWYVAALSPTTATQ